MLISSGHFLTPPELLKSLLDSAAKLFRSLWILVYTSLFHA